MTQTSYILTSLFIILTCNCCVRNKVRNTESNEKIQKNLTIEKYAFVTDTSEIRTLVDGEPRPDGYHYNPKDLVNRYLKVSITNNTTDTIFFSKPYAVKPSLAKSLLLCYSPLTGYSNDSIIWQQPLGIRDYFCPFTEAVLSKQKTERYLLVDSIDNYKFFEFSIHYELKNELKAIVSVFKLSK